jgi:hypothetical protein
MTNKDIWMILNIYVFIVIMKGAIHVSLFYEILMNSMKMNIFCIKILKVFCNCVWPFKYIVISL